ncbi:MAG: hypothetical protein H7641_08195 [Candidatus Heimdallarchaeota archaeon]|nr:hypothetical protein [Candidatus Heimdallarchaeota archaeon]MCK4877546.1 hypothetical protein [Candidatus Heimdallarchaeota archaeon]
MIRMVSYKRLGISTVTGAILGVFCILGAVQRIPGNFSENLAYLLGIWAMRVILGIVIGLAGDIAIFKGEKWQNWVNAVIRGILFGSIFSVAILLIDPFRDYATFAAGIAYGPIIDLITTFIIFLIQKKKQNKKN